ncbi:MAG: hypothetical protein ABH870_05485 [bacterium]
MIIEQIPMCEVISDAMHILTSQIGPANTARFINYFSVGFGDYTEEHKQLFAKYTVDDIVKEIKEYKKKPN